LSKLKSAAQYCTDKKNLRRKQFFSSCKDAIAIKNDS